MTVTVRDNPAAHRYEIYVDDQLAGFCTYRLFPARATIEFTHTQVDPPFTGRGLARRLVTEELDDVRDRGLRVVPFCPFVRKVIAEDPDRFLDLVAPNDRARFHLETAAVQGDAQDARQDAGPKTHEPKTPS